MYDAFKISNRISLLAIWLVAFGVSIAQQPSSFRHYGAAEGVPQSFVTGVFQDEAELIWIGTGKGLAFFNGKQFQPIIPLQNDTADLTNVFINRIIPAPDGKFFVHYQMHGWRLFDPIRRRLLTAKIEGFPAIHFLQTTSSILRDSKNRWWVKEKKNVCKMYTPDKGMLVFDSAHGFKVDMLVAITETPDKQAILLVTDKGVYHFTNSIADMVFTPFNLNKHFIFYTPTYPAVWHNSEELIIAEKNRLLRYNYRTKSMDSLVGFGKAHANEPVRLLIKGSNDKMYAEINRHVFEISETGTRLLFKSDLPAHIEADFRALHLDKAGLLWASSNANGVYAIQPAQVPVSVYAVTQNFALDVLQRVPGLPNQLLPTFNSSYTWKHALRWHYVTDSSMVVAAGLQDKSFFGPLLLHHGKWTKLPLRPRENLHFAGFTQMGDTLIGINSQGGLYKWPALGLAGSFTFSEPFNETLTGIVGLAAHHGKLLVITETSGLILVTENSELKTSGNIKHLQAPDRINGFCPDPQNPGRLYLATHNKGLLIWSFAGGFIDQPDPDAFLKTKIIYGILPDKLGRLWLSTNAGMALHIPASGKSFQLNAAKGWPLYEFNKGEVFRFADGSLAFGGIGGWITIWPQAYKADTNRINVAFTHVLVNGESIHWYDTQQPLQLTHDENSIRISFTGTLYDAQDLLEYRYQLIGFQKDWQNNGQESVINFAGLPPGKYKLAVQSRMPGAAWDGARSSELAFTIATPWYASWWAYLLYALTGIGLAYWYISNKQKQLQLSMQLQQEQVHAAQLEEFNSIRTRFFQNITHDLRTPLTLILTPATTLLGITGLSDQARHWGSMIKLQAGRLLQLVNEMLDLAKIQSGEMKLATANGQITTLLETLQQAFEGQALQKNISLQTETDMGSRLIHTDFEKLYRVLENLLNNALKFTPSGGKVVISANTGIWPDGREMVQLKVSDTGMGISKNDIELIFDRFYQREQKKQHEGTGIGLSLSKELVSLLGGKIEVASEPGVGSVFTVEIPIQPMVAGGDFYQPNLPVQQIAEMANEQLPQPESKQMASILVVEDNHELRDFVASGLAVQYNVLQATGGDEAWQMVLDELPELVITDWMMEAGDGLSLCRQIKEDLRTQHIGVVMLTAKAAVESRIAGLEVGADNYLPKPFVWQELEQTIHNLVARQNKLRIHLQAQWLAAQPLQTTPNPEDAFLQKIRGYMEDNFDGKIDVEQMAGSMNMSRRTLHRKLTALLGVSPVEYILHFRLQKAYALLRGGRTVSEAAYATGFETPSYFSKCFKQQYGVAPSNFEAIADP